ncbi:uncharacterized protein LOC5513456 isoform X2 [Nematostella vectensis]|uniref:uncharacterized protein LOC5513456 isoform X2 n=1 Tax=Nematostella vectensis TaxID=45351 RepID=UPI002077700C|nr:uncharacterized protein LOC5513456 isoform X2 [Nematostella vectensis]
MGLGLLVLVVCLVPMTTARDLRGAVNKRTAPDPLLVEIFNDPTATSLTKQHLDDSDDNSGSGLWTSSGDLPKSTDDKSISTPKGPPSGDTATAVELATNTPVVGEADVTPQKTQTTAALTQTQDATTQTQPEAAALTQTQDATTQTQQDAAALTQTQDATTQTQQDAAALTQTQDATTQTQQDAAALTQTQDATTQTQQDAAALTQTQDAVTQTQQDAAALTQTQDATAQTQQDLAAQTQLQNTAALVQTPAQTEQTTTETKDDSVTDVNTKKSAILPESSQAVTDQVEENDSSVRDSIAAPKPKSFNDASLYDADIVKKTSVPRPDDVTAMGKKSVVPPVQAQDPQFQLSFMQPSMDSMQNNQLTQQLSQAPIAAPFATQADQQPQADASQAAALNIPQAPAMAYPSEASQLDASQFQAYQSPQANLPVYPASNQYMNPNAGQQIDPSTGFPVAGMQSVPVFQGLKAKKIQIKEDECEDMYDSCPDMAKNMYCQNFAELMHVQCKKSCHFCKVKDESSGLEASGLDETSGDAVSSGSTEHADYNVKPIWKKSHIAASGEAASGGSAVSDVWSSSASGANMIQGEPAEHLAEATAAPITKKDEIAEPAVPDSAESGSGQQPSSASEDFESGSGANLAEDLATGTVSKVKETPQVPEIPKAKYSEIPKPIYNAPGAQVFPRIDLKEIATAVNAYKKTALRMLGEAIRDAAQEAEDEATKRTMIPMPPATELLEKMGFPMEEPKSEVPEPDPEQQEAYLQQQQQQAEQQQQQQQNVAKSKVEQPPEPDPEAEGSAEESKEKKSDIIDPFQYLHNMPEGASMQPIVARPLASLSGASHSSPLILFKNSQISNAAAMKKNSIPKPKKAPFIPAAPQVAQAKSDVPFSDPFSQLAALGGSEADNSQAYQQSMPDDLTGASDINDDLTKSDKSSQYQPDQQNDITNDQTNGEGLARFFDDQPSKLSNAPGPSTTIEGKEQGSDLVSESAASEETSQDRGGSFFDNAVTGRDPDADYQHDADDLTAGSLSSRYSMGRLPSTVQAKLTPEVEISGKIPKKSDVAKNKDKTEGGNPQTDGTPSFGIAADQSSSSYLPPLNQANPLTQQAGVASQPLVNYRNGNSPSNQGDENAGSLPPLNHEVENAGNLPPLNHGIENAGNLPLLNQGMELPLLNQGNAAAANLPPLNHGIESSLLPPLNHGKDNSANLPPLIYNNIETLPQLHHGTEGAANLPPLLKGVEQASTTKKLNNGDQFKNFRPPMLPPLEHAQSNPEMNFFFSNGANTEGARYKITADQMQNSLGKTSSMLPPLNHAELPPLNHAELPPMKYNSENFDGPGSTPPIYPYSIPPEGGQGYFGNSQKKDEGFDEGTFGPPLFPQGGNPYPLPLPPEGSQHDKPSSPSKKNLIRPKPDLKCGSGWTGAMGDFGAFCYKVVFDKSNWDDARANCQSAGGDLFSVTNAYEQRFLENFTNIESWLGYRDQKAAGTWRWSDGSKSVYTDWDSSAKDDHDLGMDCVVLDAEEGKWRDSSCAEKNSFLCKRDADDCPSGWKKLTLNSVRGCYKFVEDKKSWDEASSACQLDDGRLASILSDDEQTMISQVYSKADMWIGYNDKNSEGDWVWSDQMTSSYTNWDERSPNNGGVTCAIVTKKGRWHDEQCQAKYSYICKKPSPKSNKELQNDGLLTQKVQDFISNNTLIPDIDTSISIFGKSAVAPMYFWTAQKIYNNKIHGSSPIASHGHIKAVDGGLQLNGVDSWLDAGDFYGQCLGDPDLCIKGFSFAMQLNFDDDAKSYKDKRLILDSAGDSRGVSVYLQNNTVNYKVVTSTKTWKLSTELATNEWQDLVFTWKKEEGLMLYINGAFRDSMKDGTPTAPVPNKQARLTIGRQSGNAPYRYTRMYISSLYAFTRFLAPEDVPYVFTYDDTVSARYTWLLPKLQDGKIPGSPDIEVNGPVKAVDGGVHIDGSKAYLKVGNFNGRCVSDPSKCPKGLSISTKLKFNRIVRTYKEPRYIMDTGGHLSGDKGLAAYLANDNLYFTLAMSTAEDTLRWTVRTSIFTVRWQRVVLTWGLEKGLWLYIDGQFRASTKTPKTVPRDVIDESSEFIIGRKNIGDDMKPADFAIGSLAIFSQFLDKKAVSKVFGGKKMPYPGLIREIWKELPGKELSKLKTDPYYPNDPSLVEIIENFDAPFDVDSDYGSRVKGYFVAPETGNYTFYLSGSKTSELWLSTGDSQKNMSNLIALTDATGHNQWNKFTAQISKSVNLEAGKYYYITALEKGTESTDSLSAGIRLPSGRFMRPISKENLQWRLPGDPFAGVIREVWQDIPGYKITDLTSNPNFPNSPSSIEVLDKFDAPHNVDDNYGTRIRGFFKAPETGAYRFFLAADTTGELWLSADETEANLKKIVDIDGWTDHNEWLKFPEQKSEHVKLKKGRYYYLEVYHKADKLADCASVAVEFPSGHFEGPIKRVHLSWRLPDGKTGPGPSTEEEAIPKPVGLFPLTKSYAGKDASGNNDDSILSNVKLSDGPDGSPGGAYELAGTADSYIQIPNKSGKLDTKNSVTLLANIYPTGSGGPIINYKSDGWGVHLWQFEKTELFVRFVHRNGVFHKPIGTRVIEPNKWNQVGATYDNTTGVAQLWHNGKMVKSRNVGMIKLATQYDIRIGARDGDDRRFAGKIACVQIYNKALDQSQIGNLKTCPVKAPLSPGAPLDDAASGSGSGAWDVSADSDDTTAVALSHEAGKYDKDEEADDLIQGSEFTGTGKKCDPSPCENSGKCIKDAKRLDGYRCKCTSDFTGRNCQVSKPDAENPIVKRTKIPRAEKKLSSEKYQEMSTGSSLTEKQRDEKKEDVLLLFQKLGCYRDEGKRHDIRAKINVQSVTQENCARACALEERGYSYFGLQNSDQCYCGHHYGRYGKADEASCDKPCKDNADENCGGNATNMVYFFGMGTNYTVKVHTGNKENADTNAKVYVTLYGEKGDSGFRKLHAGKFEKAKDVSETMLLPELGELKKIRILHDNSGENPSWFVDNVTVTDENGKVYSFPCNEWLSETQGGGKTERLLHLGTTTHL